MRLRRPVRPGPPCPPESSRGIVAELKRRNVFRVALFYIVSSWLLLQIADLVFELLLVPDWTLRFIFGALLVAFPFVLFVAWAYEMTPDGLKRDADVDRTSSVTHETGRKLDVAVMIVAAAAIGLMAWDRLAPARPDAPTAPAEQSLATEAAGEPTPSPAASTASETGDAPAEEDAQSGISIAVLPFANMSGNPDNEYFSDGLTDTLLHVLSKVPELRVAARTSSFQFKGMAADISVIGEQLRVANLLEGSVQRSGDRVRITAQLIKTDDGFHLWSATYDRDLDDIFAVQDEIATNVVDALTERLLGDVPQAEPVDPAIFDDFLRAQALVYGKDAEQVDRAVAMLSSIVERAPEFARGHALLSEAYQEQVQLTETDWEQVEPRAETAALRAVELDPEEADGWIALASVRRRQGQLAEMLAHQQRAVELEPNGARALAEYASGLRRLNRFEESLPITRRAVLLDPLNPTLKEGLGIAYLYANRYEEAEAVWKDTLALTPDEPRILESLGNFYVLTGRWDDALVMYERMLGLNPRSFLALNRLFSLYLGAGDLQTAEAILQRMLAASKERATDERGLLCLMRGDRDCWLEAMRGGEAEVDSDPKLRARIAYVEGDLETAADLMEEALNLDLARGEVRTSARPELAALYHQLGRFEDRDRLGEAYAKIRQEALDQSLQWVYVTHYLPAVWAALQGDAAEATQLASIANRDGGPIALYIEQTFLIWDPIRDTPEFEALMVEVRERQTGALAKMRAVATWDPRAEDEEAPLP